MLTQRYINEVAYAVVGCAIEVHKHIGPGLLESIYETCLIEELKSEGFKVDSQVLVPIIYKEKKIGNSFRLDLVVEDLIIVELKAVDAISPIFKAQLLSYLKLTSMPKGLLINFNCDNIVKNGLIPLVTEHFSNLPKE